jgi:hypothetical protein
MKPRDIHSQNLGKETELNFETEEYVSDATEGTDQDPGPHTSGTWLNQTTG